MTSKAQRAWLALEDGTVFQGRSVGADGESFGELVFNTSMTGYQEVLTDPSYRGQIVVMTYPEIGIYGVNPDDVESEQIQVAGFVMHHAVRAPSNHRATLGLLEYLAQAGIVGIEGVDTRALTRHLRTHGAMRGAIVGGPDELDLEELIARVKQSPSLVGRDLVQEVTGPGMLQTPRSRTRRPRCAGSGALHIVVIDAGHKAGIVRDLMCAGATVTIVSYDASFESVMRLKPDGVLVSNGPGDPEPLDATVALVRELLRARVPLAGICLGHQLLALAVGGRTYKMRFGHRGANHPIKVLAGAAVRGASAGQDGRIVITTQNHGFAVDPTSLGIGWAPLDAAFQALRPELCPETGSSGQVTMAERLPAEALVGESPLGFGPIEVTHLSLNDGTVEGLRLRDYPAFSVQFHPEASPGPCDTKGFCTQFMSVVAAAAGTVAPAAGTVAREGDDYA
jgi:carbamoyl-phosphate synthase small subunit